MQHCGTLGLMEHNELVKEKLSEDQTQSSGEDPAVGKHTPG